MNLTLEAIPINASALPVASSAQLASGLGGLGGFASTLAAVQQAALQRASTSGTESEQQDEEPAMGIAKSLTAAASLIAKGTKKSASFEPPTPANSGLPALPAILPVQPAITSVPLVSNLGELPSTTTSQNFVRMAESSASKNFTIGNDASGSLQTAAKNMCGPTPVILPTPTQLDNAPVASRISERSPQSTTVAAAETQTIPAKLAMNALPLKDSRTLDVDQASLQQLTAPEARSLLTVADVATHPALSSTSQPPSSAVQQPSMQESPFQEQSLQQSSPQQSSPELVADIRSTPQAGAASPVISMQPDAAGSTASDSMASAEQAGPILNVDGPIDIAQLEAMPVASAHNLPIARSVNQTSAQTATAALLAKMANPQSSATLNAAVNANPQQLALLGKVTASLAGSKPVPAVSATNVRTDERSVSSNTNSAVSGDSYVSTGSSAAVETPFSVFFSSPGPGTESAAATLPNMLLPGSAALGHGGLPVTNFSSGSLAGNAQSVGGLINKDSLSANQSAASPTGTSFRKDEVSGAQPVASSQALESPVPAAASSASSSANQPSPVPAAVMSSAAAGAVTAGAILPSTPPAPKSAVPAETPSGSFSNPTPISPQPLPNATPGPVQMAQMANRAGESEMRIGMNTSAFGNVEVRTTVHAGDVGLTIGSEKGDLRSLLTNDMPAIANTLQQQNLRLSNVSFMQGFSSSSNGSSNNGAGAGNPQQPSFVPRSAYGGIAGDLSIEDSVEELPFNESALASSSLSILA